jgi:hypothetical protein
MLLFIHYNAFTGTLLLQHRFTGTLVILSLPFFALYFDDYSKKKTRNTIIYGILTIGLSFAWNTTGVKPLPRLHDQSGEKIAGIIQHETDAKSGLILDFWSWENTYYIALHAHLSLDHIVLIGGSKNEGLQKERIALILNEYAHGIIVVKKDSPLFKEIKVDKDRLHFNGLKPALLIVKLFHSNDVMVFKYHTIP